MAVVKKLKLRQGEFIDNPLYVKYLDANGVEQPVNLTGCSARIQIRKKQADYETYVHAELSTANGKLLLSDAVNGKFLLNVTAAESRDWKFDEAFFELEITYSTGRQKKYAVPCTLVREYTR